MKHSTLDQPLGLYPIRLMALALLCWLLTAMPISAAQFGACDDETSLQADQESFEVGSINIRRLNVFSEEQAVSWPYGLANKVHVITSDTLIRRQLLFQPGDVIDHHRFWNLKGGSGVTSISAVPRSEWMKTLRRYATNPATLS